MSDEARALEDELRLRVQEVEALALEVRHLQDDLRVKDAYIRELERVAPATPAEALAAERYLRLRDVVRTWLSSHPAMRRAARWGVRTARRVRR